MTAEKYDKYISLDNDVRLKIVDDAIARHRALRKLTGQHNMTFRHPLIFGNSVNKCDCFEHVFDLYMNDYGT